MGDKFDPELVQARWVLGGIRPEDLPDLAVVALEQALDGTALHQLAGLAKPTRADFSAVSPGWDLHGTEARRYNIFC